ncbi:hypothetical protein SEMRO_1641_G287970.1 [Seminavis robusta]|uniref:Uncharacterized protein n=1 Tax=Seminavis robusta TaxID=568900 RepID=A0A9N8ETH1_9STRA|nr:hypothetical protein SEMRO_1641_G287970.1 [Seminavis robusta]|eukprot:Sro1641_g287970.1 n/a (606) ;mRNA; r:6351-8168
MPTLVSVYNEAEAIQLDDSLNQQFIQLVGKESNEDDGIEYGGFALTNSFGRDIFHGRFREPLRRKSTSVLHVKCLHIRCFTSDDLKCNTSVMGQGTAGVMAPCTICVCKKKEFGKYLTLPLDQQPALRKGVNANPSLYEAFIAEAGGRVDLVRASSTGQAKGLKMKYHSVIYQPLLYTPPELNSGSGMHVSSGLFTHCTIKMLEACGKIDRELPWLSKLSTLQQEAKDFVVNSKVRIEQLRKEDTKLYRDIKTAQGYSLTGEIESIKAERLCIASDLHALAKASEAAKLFIEKGNDFQAGAAKKTKSRIIGPATYCLRKAYEVDGRVSFRVENSGFELSNGDGIRVLAPDRQELIAERMKKVFPNNLQLQSKVDKAMESYRGLTELLYQISTIMKSQKKWIEEDVARFDAITRQYATLWMEFTMETQDVSSSNGNEINVFNKLHILRSHLTTFASTNLMLGRCSEEGFESAHKCIESVRQPLVCMTSTEARANCTFRRIMLHCRPEIEVIHRAIEQRFMGKKRAPYKKRTKALKTADNTASASQLDPQLTLPEDFTRSINGYIIKTDWKDHFEYVVFSKVPASWTQPFQSDESLGSSCQATAEYV